MKQEIEQKARGSSPSNTTTVGPLSKAFNPLWFRKTVLWQTLTVLCKHPQAEGGRLGIGLTTRPL